jgi:hypothetical protein
MVFNKKMRPRNFPKIICFYRWNVKKKKPENKISDKDKNAKEKKEPILVHQEIFGILNFL